MGGRRSWLTAVKKALAASAKEKEDDMTNTRRREDDDPEDDEKKRGKGRWVFRRTSIQESNVQHCETRIISSTANIERAATSDERAFDAQHRRAIAVAMATAAAAQAAAQAAVEVFRLSRPSLFVGEHSAALLIQKALRGYLARRALQALKGIVKLQALVRGYNVRRRAQMTLQCMEALVRVQARVLQQRISREDSAYFSDHSGQRGSRFADTRKSAATSQEESRRYSQQVSPSSQPFSHFSGFFESNGRRYSCEQRDPIEIVEIEMDTSSRPYSPSPRHYQKSQKQHHQSPVNRAHTLLSLRSSTSSPSKTKKQQIHSASPRCTRVISGRGLGICKKVKKKKH